MFFLETENINQLVVNPKKKKIQNKLTRNEFLLLFIKIEINYNKIICQPLNESTSIQEFSTRIMIHLVVIFDLKYI
jgi:hypothetical protein